MMRMWTVGVVGMVVACLVVSLGAPAAGAAQRDGANCDAREVIVTGKEVPVMSKPWLKAAREDTMSRGELHKCGAVEVGGVHDLCGARESNVWMIITGDDRKVYVPSHCVADVHR